VTPEEAGLMRCTQDDLKGGSAKDNAVLLRDMLQGRPGPYRTVAVLNAAGALLAIGAETGLAQAARLAEKAIDDGRAEAVLDRLVMASNQELPPQ